jgi:hypothetical protein
MPTAIPAFIAAVASIPATITGAVKTGLILAGVPIVHAGGIANFLVQGAALAGLSAAMMPKPEAGHQNIRQSVPPRIRAYGVVRIGAPHAFFGAAA